MTKFVYMLLMVLTIQGLSLKAYALNIVGQARCNEWTKVRAEYYDEALNYQMWLEGYLSGMVFATKKDVLVATGTELRMNYVDQYCKIHPSDFLDDAGNDLFLYLNKQKGL